MPRIARKVAESGFYHVMLKGNGGQIIFDDDEDRRAFLAALSSSLEGTELSLIAWCLMSTHVHLLLSDESGCLSSVMHSLATKYAGHFNSRTGHLGSVFSGRFKSVPVESDAQLIAAVRYIHNNPEKAGICPAAEYGWSSYHEYVSVPFITNVNVVLDLLGGVEGFVAMSEAAPAVANSGMRAEKLSATIDGKRIETVEVSLSKLTVVQSRGVCNQCTDYHARIIDLVNRNMPLIQQRIVA